MGSGTKFIVELLGGFGDSRMGLQSKYWLKFSWSLGEHYENFQHSHSTPVSKIWESYSKSCLLLDLLGEMHCQKQEEALFVLFGTF